jgi:hypothetical protein
MTFLRRHLPAMFDSFMAVLLLAQLISYPDTDVWVTALALIYLIRNWHNRAQHKEASGLVNIWRKVAEKNTDSAAKWMRLPVSVRNALLRKMGPQ